MSSTENTGETRPPVPDDRESVEQDYARVLVVDDRQENRFATRQILEQIGVFVDEAASGEDALPMLLRNRYAVVLMDVQMPRMDGYETVKLMRQHRQTRDVPVIFLTAIATDERYVDMGYMAGAVDYLAKPIKPQTLMGKVRVFIEMAARRDQLQNSLAQLERLGRHNKLILDYASEGIIGVDSEGAIVSANPAAERMLNYAPGTLTKTTLQTIVLGGLKGTQDKAWKKAWPIFEAIANEHSCRSTEDAFWCSDGSTISTEFSYAPFTRLKEAADRGNTKNEGGVLIFQDIGEKLEAQKQLLRMAKEDPLTGIPNRTYLKEVLQAAIKRYGRGEKYPAFMLLDLDNFKHINDRFGHDVGDQVLVEASKRFGRCLRGTDVVARLGGDEFGISLDGIARRVHAARVAEKVIDALNEPFLVGGQVLSIGASIGIAIYPDNGADALGLLKAADIAMYEAKLSGRNRFNFFTKEMQERAVSRSQFEHDMANGLPDEFYCDYQPIVDAGSGRIKSLEALARWKHPQRGQVGPDVFISIAEESSFIVKLGEHLMRTACRQARGWLDAGTMQAQHRVAINISAQQLIRGGLFETLERILDETGLPAENLQIEVTESTLLADPDLAVSVLKSLRDQGIEIQLDDFGTGYSSLSHLARLPITGLKIDRSFVNNLISNQNDQVIVLATINLAHAMQLTVTAEGVETKEQLEFLRAHGCDRLQGYYFSKPRTGDVIAELFSDLESGAADSMAKCSPEALEEVPVTTTTVGR